MPSQFAEPTLEDFLRVGRAAIPARADRYGDTREGSIYDHFIGLGAVLWSRQARRDTDLFRAIYLDGADGDALTTLLADRYGFTRRTDTAGEGTAAFTRAAATAGEGTVWAGTRILVGSATTEPRGFVVTTDTPVAATDLDVTVPVRDEKAGSAAFVLSTGLTATIDDPLWDATWTVDALRCAAGTRFESAADARARLRDDRRAARAGFPAAILQACRDAGAATAVAFPSDYGGSAYDHGLNLVYVGDEGFQGSQALVNAVMVALDGWRVLGDNLQVRALARTSLPITARVYLWDSPTKFNQTDVRRALVGAIVAYFDGRSNGFAYQRDAIAGAMMRASQAVQYVEFDAPLSDAGVLETVGGLPNFPAALNKYDVSESGITLTLLPPA